MSKYNLIDIYEQYQIGSGWTRNFDYEGMLNAGLKIDTDTPIEVMKKISDDFEDVNYHRENNYLQDAIDALEAGDVFGANGKLNDFRHEIKNTMAKYEMDMSDDLGAYMASKMDMMNEDEFDEARQSAIESSQEKAGVKEGISTSDITKALKDIATDSEIKQYMASVKKAGDKFDDVDDYVEDFKNYVADKALQEHFGRFMKDYQ